MFRVQNQIKSVPCPSEKVTQLHGARWTAIPTERRKWVATAVAAHWSIKRPEGDLKLLPGALNPQLPIPLHFTLLYSTPFHSDPSRNCILCACRERVRVSCRYVYVPPVLHGHKWATKHDRLAASTDIPLKEWMCSTRKSHPQPFPSRHQNINHGYTPKHICIYLRWQTPSVHNF